MSTTTTDNSSDRSSKHALRGFTPNGNGSGRGRDKGSDGEKEGEEEGQDAADDIVVEKPNLKTRSVQELLDGGMSMSTLAHHGGSGSTYMATKILKLQNMHSTGGGGDTSEHSGGVQACSTVFQGCFVFVNGDTTPSRYEIQRLVMLHGGNFDAYKTSRTTHFLCDHFPNTKRRELAKHHPRIRLKYVTVAWLLASIQAGRRLSEALFTPEGLQGGQSRLDLLQTRTTAAISSNSNTSTNTSSSESCSKISSSSTRQAIGVSSSADPNTAANTSENDGNTSIYSTNNNNSSRDTAARAYDEKRGGAADLPASAKDGGNRQSSSSGNSGSYMNQFFGASRLHFIGTWRSRLPALMEELEQEEEQRERQGGVQRRQYDIERFVSPSPPMHSDDKCMASGGGSCSSSGSSCFVHIDMDCFFVAVLIRTRPQLWARPVAVAHSSSAGASEVSSCNYPARARGVAAGMFMKQALSLCPDLLVLRYDFEQYEAVSRQLYRLCLAFSPASLVQPVSVDELYIQIQTPSGGQRCDVVAAVQFLREEIFRQTGCSASAGVGKNMLLARLGTAKAKPNGLFVVPSSHLPCASSSSSSSSSPCSSAERPLSPTLQFMEKVPLRSLPGVGRKLMKKVLAQFAGKKTSSGVLGGRRHAVDEYQEDEDEEEERGDGESRSTVRREVPLSSSTPLSAPLCCGDLWGVSESTLASWLGGTAMARSLHAACRGLDSRALQPITAIAAARKSVGAEVNYGHRYQDDEQGTAMHKAEAFLLNLCDEVLKRLAQARMCGHCVTVKLMKRRAGAAVNTTKYLGHGVCDTMSKSQTFATAIGRAISAFSSSVSVSSSNSDANSLSSAALALFRSMVSATPGASTFPPEDIRGMGVQVTRLESTVNPGGEKGSTNSGGAIEQFFTSVTSSVPSSDGNILTRMKSSAKQSPDGRRALLFPPFPAATSSGVAASKRKTTSADYNFEYDFELPPASQLDYAVLAEVQASLTNTDGSGGRVNNFGSRVSSSHTRLHSAGVGTATLATIAPRTDPCSGSSRSRSSSLISEEEGELSYSQADFVRNIPEELRQEVLQQMPPRRKKRLTTAADATASRDFSKRNHSDSWCGSNSRREMHGQSARNTLIVLEGDEEKQEEGEQEEDCETRAGGIGSPAGLHSLSISPLSLPLAPSVILPHEWHSLSFLQDLLATWGPQHPPLSLSPALNSGDQEREGEVSANGCTSAPLHAPLSSPLRELSSSRRQALSSYAIWLVNSQQLDKAKGLVGLLGRLSNPLRGTGGSFWAAALEDVKTGVQLSCEQLYGCPAAL